MHHLEPILNFAGQHADLAHGTIYSAIYSLIFLVALAESLGLAGLLVPGSILLFAFAALAGTGHLALVPVFLLALAGAVAADLYNYRLGLRYRKQLRQPRLFSHHPRILDDADGFLLRHGEKSMVFARFAGLIHPLIAVRAGMQHMPAGRFFAASFVSALCWTGAHILAGLLFGIFFSIAGVVSGRLALLLMLVILGLWSFFWLCRRILFIAVVFGQKWFIDLRQWAQQATPSSHRPVRLVQRLLADMFSLGHRAEVLTLFLGIMVLAAGTGFAAVVQDVLAKDTLVLVDQSVFHFIQRLRSHWADTFFVAVTELGDSFVNTTLVVAILIVLLILRQRRTALFWLLTAVGGAIGMQVLKWSFQQPRPTNLYEGIASFSFPSGHTTMSVVIYGFLAIILAKNLAGLRQWLVFSSVLVIAFLIGFSRLYLGAHWFSDVLGGTLVGAAWAALMGIFWLQHADKRMPRRLLVLTVFVVHCTAGAWHVLQRHGQDLELYAPRLIEQNLAFTTWQRSDWQHLPAARLDMEGELEQPLTIQWAGRPEDIRQVLDKQGWQPAPALGLRHLLALLTPNAAIAALPVLPQLHEGREESLLMVRDAADSRLVLRLWRENIVITPQQIPLFIGSIEEEHSTKFGRLLTIAHAKGNHGKMRQQLAQELRAAAQPVLLIEVQRRGENRAKDKEATQTGRQGQVLLIGPG
ncbi:MAG: phosphatase PAP2 family protein [bacterium]|nr:phosphatase PAP2 family protein [bacterium]